MLEVHSKDNSKCMYDYAEEYYKIETYIEKEEKRKVTPEEKLLIFAMLASEDMEGQ